MKRRVGDIDMERAFRVAAWTFIILMAFVVLSALGDDEVKYCHMPDGTIIVVKKNDPCPYPSGEL